MLVGRRWIEVLRHGNLRWLGNVECVMGSNVPRAF
jgi:hypothetical protein